MKFEYLSGLEFFDQGFAYRGKRYRYDRIEAITFSATHIQQRPAGSVVHDAGVLVDGAENRPRLLYGACKPVYPR